MNFSVDILVHMRSHALLFSSNAFRLFFGYDVPACTIFWVAVEVGTIGGGAIFVGRAIAARDATSNSRIILVVDFDVDGHFRYHQ